MVRPARLTRRGLLATGAALVAGVAAAAPGPRVAVLDWALLETLLAIGVVPVAAAELVLYRSIAVEPPVPTGVADIGLRGAPNFEALRTLAPELILSSDFYAWAEPKLARIAPVETVSIFRAGGRPYAAAEQAALTLGERTGRLDAARAFVAEAGLTLAALKARLGGGDGRPLIPINFGDARHVRVFGPDSMFGEVLARLGFANAWTRPTRYAASAPVGLEVLAEMPDAWIVVIAPVPADARRVLADGAFWHALPGVRAGRVVILDSVDPFGGLPAALRFARLLAEALPAPAGRGGHG
ncbi:ABC transporter substrate-binding protein [Labrys wisconsinensis]|uniref:Iron complex transport system substrate-binding protein n=1 Tax=Labrys wisconsinensis TaxID=425677 RepID=A0ABU0J1H5_9HYPH|nr:ABC transporter substrate-binding protein [Labrys wisconsinensis]MDQ0468093.1 iron complex transport system substrate-binding protein [Labrys wisconsinensis]